MSGGDHPAPPARPISSRVTSWMPYRVTIKSAAKVKRLFSTVVRSQVTGHRSLVEWEVSRAEPQVRGLALGREQRDFLGLMVEWSAMNVIHRKTDHLKVKVICDVREWG